MQAQIFFLLLFLNECTVKLALLLMYGSLSFIHIGLCDHQDVEHFHQQPSPNPWLSVDMAFFSRMSCTWTHRVCSL